MKNTWQLYRMPEIETDAGAYPAETVEANHPDEARYFETLGGIALDMDSQTVSAWNRAYEVQTMHGY